jgi:RNA polymerase sigma factor (sigma-70 family)
MVVEQPQLEEHMDVVRGLARGLARRLRSDSIDIEECEADGFEALVKALRDHDTSKGPLMPYIVLRCRGAMIDGLRKKMLVSRNDQAKGVTEPEVISLEHEVEEGVRLLDVLPDPNAPTPGVARAHVTNIAAEVAALPKRHQRILLMRFLQRRTQKETAVAAGVAPQTLAHIESRIRRRLRASAPLAKEDELPADDNLTAKELTVLRLAAEGASAAETATALCKAIETVKTQRSTIIAKLHARNMTNAVALSYQRGLLS